VIAAAAALSSCGGGGSGSGSPAPPPNVAVVAPDGVLRALGEPCSGGEPYLYAHATATFRIEDAAGKTVLRGDLPEGKAIPALNHDPGVPRVPTFCRFELHADLASGPKYRMVLSQGDPLPLTFKDGLATVVLE
jgi:hypothetical protein